MTIEITAAVLHQRGAMRPYYRSEPLRLERLELAAPRAGELLVRIDAAGLCHSDLSVVNGDRPRPLPMALGHEATGIVEEIRGANDRGIAVGDRVVLAFLPSCGECARCCSGEPYLCEPASRSNAAGELLSGGTRLGCGDQRVLHHLGVSAFATHAVVDARSAVKVDADIDPSIAALFGCAALTGVGAVRNTAALKAGESVVIFGLGGVGLAAVLGALAADAGHITVVDPSPAKRALALDLGAHEALDPACEEAAALPARGFDVAIEGVGSASVLAQAYAALRRGGRLIAVGLPHPAQEFRIPAASLTADAKQILGSYMGASDPRRDIPELIDLWRAGRLPVDRLLTATLPLTAINEALETLAAGQAVRLVLRPDAQPDEKEG